MSVVLATMAVVSEEDPKPKATVAKLAWMAGTWSGTQGGVEIEEHWTTPKGGLLLGTNRSLRGKEPAAFEFLRIANTEAGISYFASPMGRAATEFPLKSLENEKVTFENPKHDFPQRIIYWKADGKLHARIEGTIGGKQRSEEWVWSSS